MRSSWCCESIVMRRVSTASFVPCSPFGCPSTLVPSTRNSTGIVCMIVRLVSFAEAFFSLSRSARRISRSVTIPPDGVKVTSPVERISSRPKPPKATRALFIGTLADDDARASASLMLFVASLGSIIKPWRTPLEAAIPVPIICIGRVIFFSVHAVNAPCESVAAYDERQNISLAQDFACHVFKRNTQSSEFNHLPDLCYSVQIIIFSLHGFTRGMLRSILRPASVKHLFRVFSG